MGEIFVDATINKSLCCMCGVDHSEKIVVCSVECALELASLRMVAVNRCGNCKYLGDPFLYSSDDPPYEPKPTGFYTCDLVKHVNSFWSNKQEIPKGKACVQDGSGYFAALRVKEDFGCIEFQSKVGK